MARAASRRRQASRSLSGVRAKHAGEFYSGDVRASREEPHPRVRREGEIRWTLRAPRGAEAALDLFERLPGELSAGMSERDAEDAIARLNRALRR